MTIAQLLRFTAERYLKQKAQQAKQQAVGVASPLEQQQQSQQRPAA